MNAFLGRYKIVPQKVAEYYPYLFEEASIWKELVGELESLFATAQPDHTFQFHQETAQLKEKQREILVGGTIYKRVTDGGNVGYYGTFRWVIGTDDEILARGCGIARGCLCFVSFCGIPNSWESK